MIKKIIGALMILVFFGTIFISSIIVHGLIETLISIFIEIVLVSLLIGGLLLLLSD